MLSAGSGCDENGDDGRDPGPALVDVEDLEAAEGNAQAQKRDDDDSHCRAEVSVANGRQTLAANNGHDDAEAGEGCQVEEDGDGDEVATEAEAGLDHLAHSRLGAHGSEVRWQERGEEGEEDDDQRAVTQAEAVDRAEHAKCDAAIVSITGISGSNRRGYSRKQVGVHAPPDGEDIRKLRVCPLLDGDGLDAAKLDAAKGSGLVEHALPSAHGVDLALRRVVVQAAGGLSLGLPCNEPLLHGVWV